MKTIRCPNRRMIRESIGDSLRQNCDFYITCCIPVIPFCLSVHMLLYLRMEYERDIGGFGNVLLLSAVILLLVCLAVFRYSLRAYMRQKSEKYSILLMLGITVGDFWRNLAAEYCPAFLVTVACTAFLSSAASNLLMAAAIRKSGMEILMLSVRITGLLVLLFAAGMAGVFVLLIIRQWRKDLANYLEAVSYGKEVLHRFRISYGMKIAMALMCQAGACYLLYRYTVGRMMIAAVLHLGGVGFLLRINGRLVRKMALIRKKWYFPHLLLWNDLIYEYRLNGNLVYAVYGVNFIMVFLFGGLFASDYPEDILYTAIKAMFAVVGISIILEEQMLVLQKMILDLRNQRERHAVLFQLGMEQAEYRRMLRRKMLNIIVLPAAAASVMGAVFFLCDYGYQGDITSVREMWSPVLLKYLCAVALFWIVQYCGYLFLKRSVFRKYIDAGAVPDTNVS